MQNLSYENAFESHENKPVGGMHFHMNGFTQRLILTLRHTKTRKWPVVSIECNAMKPFDTSSYR